MRASIERDTLMKEPTLISYPRSGSNFLINEYARHTDKKLTMYHVPIDVDNRISCIRNPLDSVSSLLTMEYKSLKPYFMSKMSEAKFKNFLHDRAAKLLFDYKTFYEFLDTHEQALLIQYDNLCEKPADVVKYIANYFDVKLRDAPDKFAAPKNNPSRGYFVSSSHLLDYPMCKEIVSQTILAEHVDIFESVKNKVTAI